MTATTHVPADQRPARMSREEMDALKSPDVNLYIAALLAGPANVIMQMANTPVGRGVVESRVESGSLLKHPVKRTRTTLTYLAVAALGTASDRKMYREAVNSAHRQVHSNNESPVKYNAMDPKLQMWVAACLYRGWEDITRLYGRPGEVNEQAYRQGAVMGTTLQMPYVFVALGLVLLTGVAGLTSFGQAAFVGVGAYAAGYMVVSLQASAWLALAVGIALAVVAALLLGLLTLRMSGHYLPLATICWGLALNYTMANMGFLGKYDGINGIPSLDLFGLELGSGRGLHGLIWAVALVCAVGVTNLLDSRVGRAIRSLKTGSTMAEAMGISTFRYKLIAFILAAVLAAILACSMLKKGSPNPKKARRSVGGAGKLRNAANAVTEGNCATAMSLINQGVLRYSVKSPPLGLYFCASGWVVSNASGS